jgi:hypothetical protein
MKHIFTNLTVVILLLATKVEAQFTQKCASYNAMQKIEETQSGYMQGAQSLFTSFNSINDNRAISDTFLFVRVVVHVVYNTPEENLADSVILNQINILNNDYGRMNADTINMRTIFAPVAGVDSRIRFILADTDPQGNPTTGITRTSTTKTTFFSFLGGGLAEDVKSTANGGKDPWDQSRYLNIWVCDLSIPFLGPGILGYAVPPSGLPNWDPAANDGIGDGVVIQYQVFGSNNPNPLTLGATTFAVKGRTPVHEVGHYLGLRHIWGDETGCVGDDGIADTPSATDASSQDCDSIKNTCLDNIAGIDLPDMIENYMDYSAEDCQNSFTKNQVEFVRWVLRNFRTDIATVSFTDIKDMSKKEIISIAPNPANENVNIIANNGSKIISVSVYNTAGQKVLINNCNDYKANINTSSLAEGVYVIELTTQQTIQRSKLVVNH